MRLSWALPLVLLAGVAIMLLLKRVLNSETTREPGRRMVLRESLTLSGELCVHLIELDGKAYLITECAKQSGIHAVSTQVSVAGRPRWGFAHPWTRLARRAAS